MVVTYHSSDHCTGGIATIIIEGIPRYSRCFETSLQVSKRKKEYALVKKGDNKDGLMIHSDSDWGGLYDTSSKQEMRSRTGVIITYNGMPV